MKYIVVLRLYGTLNTNQITASHTVSTHVYLKCVQKSLCTEHAGCNYIFQNAKTHFVI